MAQNRESVVRVLLLLLLLLFLLLLLLLQLLLPPPPSPLPAERWLPNRRGDVKEIYILQGMGTAGGETRHFGVPMLRRYAITSALLL